MNIEIERLQKNDEKQWDEFVEKSANSTVYHYTGWKNVIEKSYRLKPHYLVAKQQGVICGILPLFSVDRKLISIPFAPYGGACSISREVEHHLIDYAISITTEERFRYLEIRSLSKIQNFDFSCDTTYSTFLIKLDQEPEDIWKSLPQSTRRLINKAMKLNIEIRWEERYLKDFFRLYSITNRDFGTPVHSYSFLENIVKEFGDKVLIESAFLDEQFIGGKFLFKFKDTLLSNWAVTNPKYRKISPNSILTWSVFAYGRDHHFSTFDFGRSEQNTGSFGFKNKWGNPEIMDIFTQHFIVGKNFPQSVSKYNMKRKTFSALWRLLPLPLTVALGPTIRKRFP